MKTLLNTGLAAALFLALARPACGQIPATLSDLGGTPPTPGTSDIAQLVTGAGSPDGLNYYFDNGNPPGQTFTTGADPAGYLLNSLALGTAGNSGSLPAAGQAYLLRLYSVSGNTATLLVTYTSAPDFTFTDNDWLQWTGLGFPLTPNTQYAYSFARTSSGWENMGNISANPYAGGEVALIPPNGGTITFGASHDFDASFVAGMDVATSITVATPRIAPQNSVVIGTPVTLSVTAIGPGPLTYQWRTDGGSGAALTNIPSATGPTLSRDTTGWAAGAYQFDVVVGNGSGSVTSSVAILGVIAPVSSAALTDLGGTASPGPNDITQFVGGGNRDGLNYYDDNGPNHDGWTGQTFTTGPNSQGYYLTSVAFRTGGGTSSGVANLQPYELLLYSVRGGTATLMAHYTNASFSFQDGDWLQWSGFQILLRSNATYAYAFGRSASGNGWEALAVSPENATDLYPGGQICLLPAAGGTMTFGTSGTSDAVFDVGLLPVGVGPDPKPFAGVLAVAPSGPIVSGTQLTLSQAATGAAPLHFQWQTDGGAGVLTNIAGASGTNLILNTTGWQPGTYQFALIVTNLFGSSTSAVTTVSVLYANTSASLTDIGTADPKPAPNDVAQLLTGFGKPDGLNYYVDNASPPGQTFTTGNDSHGYLLNSLAIRTSGNSAGSLPAAGQAYVLRLYAVSGSTAILQAIFTSATNFTFIESDWLQWSGFSVPLANNVTYAYTFARISSGAGWENLGNVAGDLYPGGEVAMIPIDGGTIQFGSSHGFDAAFIVGLVVLGSPVVSPIVVSPSRTIYAGTSVNLSAQVTGPGAITYQWQTDGGNAGATLTNIPGAVTTGLVVDTTALGGLTPSYALVAANSSGSTTSEGVTLTVNAASLPVIVTDTIPAAATRFTGGAVNFTAAFDGTLPITYHWQVDKGTGATNILGQTNAALTLTGLTTADAGYYSLLASNALGTASSAPGTLTVLPQPSHSFTANFQWHSKEGNNDVGNYSGAGVPGFGSGTYWNQVPGPSAWAPGTYASATGLADDGTTDLGISWTVVTGGSWDWANSPAIPLLFSAASAYGNETFTFDLPNGVYNLVLFSCNGSEAVTTNGGTIFTVQGTSKTALPTQNTAFTEGDTYVVFQNLVVTTTSLGGTWAPVPGKSYGSLNGAQLEDLGPAISLSIAPVANGQLQLRWAQGTLLEADSLAGPWTSNSATSPYTLSPAGAEKFYRVKVQ